MIAVGFAACKYEGVPLADAQGSIATELSPLSDGISVYHTGGRPGRVLPQGGRAASRGRLQLQHRRVGSLNEQAKVFGDDVVVILGGEGGTETYFVDVALSAE